MESLLSLAIFGSFVWLCIIVVALLAAFFWAENVEHGEIAFVAALCFVLINHFWGNLPLLHFVTWTNVLSYLGVGLVYAVIRAYFFGRKSPSDNKNSQTYFATKAIDNLKGNVFRWWFIWPISLINWIVSDLIKDMWDWIYQRFQGVFEYFFKLGQSSVKKEKS